MTVIGHSSLESRNNKQSFVALLLPVYVATIFLSAFLLFSVQPMFTRMVLPVLGGSPSVWSVAMVFFQALLLAGYAYAHTLAKLSLRVAALLHLAVLACALATMPVELASGWSKPPASGEALWLLGVFVVSVGFPFFALAANGPLLQAWFARSPHPHASDPYFLYGASNIGSFVALVAYPLAIEPLIALHDQSRWWMVGFVVLALLIAASAAMTFRRAAVPPQQLRVADVPAAAMNVWRQRLGWIAVSFVPSGLLISVTAHISTDIAAAPLLWVAPLALFLLTFVLAFREQPVVSDAVLAYLQVGGTALALLPQAGSSWLSTGLTLHLGLFLVNAMICHGALYRRRPPSSRLTEFYLCLSLGGVLGGIFCGLLAPRIFSTVLEYPILLGAALCCRPGFLRLVSERLRVALRLSAFIVLALVGMVWFVAAALPSDWQLLAVFGPVAGAMIVAWRKPEYVAPFALALSLATAATQGPLLLGKISSRSFFGVHKIGVSPDGHFRTLSHGTTLHGAMRINNEDGSPFTGRPEPTTYYGLDAAMGSAIAAIRARQGGFLASVDVIGLGSGSLACHARSAEAWTFLEIDAEVVRIATDNRLFRFISACAPQTKIVLGDARLTLAEQSGQKNLIVVDAFSSDAIPSHLMTAEALALYLSKLTPTGALVIHITNRHLELRHILARAAAEHGLVAYVQHESETGVTLQQYRAPSVVVAIARSPDDLGVIASGDPWTLVRPDMTRRPWTDDFSNVVEAIVDRARR